MRTSEWKYLESVRDGWIELYNIREDKYETFDLRDIKPEVLILLKKQFGEWEKDLPPPLWPRIMDFKIIIDGKEYLFPA
jgi:hypothetical protein